MIGGGFFGCYEGEGSIQNVENYGLEVPAKTPSLYLVQKLRNLIFWDFGGVGVSEGGFRENFWGTIDVGSIQNEENK